MDLNRPWTFDRSVAAVFDSHARQNIPQYERVVELSVEAVQARCGADDPIAEIGCATGYTLRQLERVGFRNVTGVDNSVAMLERCRPTSAKLVCSDSFPVEHGPFQAVIMNWTLHFVPPSQRYGYLEDVKASLMPGGLFVLTEKTQQSSFVEARYHDFKHANGMSRTEILAKKQSLVGVLESLPLEWYATCLASLGLQWEVILAEYGFVTFLITAPERQPSA